MCVLCIVFYVFMYIVCCYFGQGSFVNEIFISMWLFPWLNKGLIKKTFLFLGPDECMKIKLEFWMNFWFLFLHPRNLSFSFAFMLLYAYRCQSDIMGLIYGNWEWTCTHIPFMTHWNSLTHTHISLSHLTFMKYLWIRRRVFREGFFRRKSLTYLLVYLRMFHEWDPMCLLCSCCIAKHLLLLRWDTGQILSSD